MVNGTITERQGAHLLGVYGLPRSAGPRVYTGTEQKPEKLW